MFKRVFLVDDFVDVHQIIMMMIISRRELGEG
jgi:hypothetical protein